MKAKDLIKILEANPEMDIFIQEPIGDCHEVNSFNIVNLADISLDDGDVIFTKDYSSTSKIDKNYKVFNKYEVDFDGLIKNKKEDLIFTKNVLVISTERSVSLKPYTTKMQDEQYEKEVLEKKFIKKLRKF